MFGVYLSDSEAGWDDVLSVVFATEHAAEQYVGRHFSQRKGVGVRISQLDEAEQNRHAFARKVEAAA